MTVDGGSPGVVPERIWPPPETRAITELDPLPIGEVVALELLFL